MPSQVDRRGNTCQEQTHQGSHEQALKSYANLPLTFIENRGQTDARVRYYANGPRYAFYLTDEEVVLTFDKRSVATSASTGSKPSASDSFVPAKFAEVENAIVENSGIAREYVGARWSRPGAPLRW